jgi:hypothetical protein
LAEKKFHLYPPQKKRKWDIGRKHGDSTGKPHGRDSGERSTHVLHGALQRAARAGLGLIGIYHKEVRPFTDNQIALVQNFAAQAVIAIENARLLNELRQRTADLTDALEQQTAASHVLSIISSSPAELEPVFQAILANATRLCGAKFANLNLYDGELLRYVASYNVPQEYADLRLRERLWRPHPRGDIAKVIRAKQPVQVEIPRRGPKMRDCGASRRCK